MAVIQKHILLRNHSLLHLRLAHAAIGSYPSWNKKHQLTVNRLLMVFDDSGADDSYMRDLHGGRLMAMRKGFVYFIPCGHEIDLNLTDELLFVSLQFNLDLFYGFDVFKDYGKCVVTKNPALIAEAKQLMAREEELRTLCRVNEIVYNLCVSLLTDHPEPIQHNCAKWHKYESLLDFVERSGDALTTVAMLAEMNNMRQDVFSRKFTGDMGITPKEFLNNTLMRKATKMLLAPGARSRTVAEELNFSSEYYFSRFFKKHTGASPRLFRKMNGGQ